MTDSIRREMNNDLRIATRIEEGTLGRPLTPLEAWNVRRKIYAAYKRFLKKDKRTPLEIERDAFLEGLKLNESAEKKL